MPHILVVCSTYVVIQGLVDKFEMCLIIIFFSTYFRLPLYDNINNIMDDYDAVR